MRTAARAIVLKNDTLLVMDRNKFGNKYYSLIGGGVDAGETIEEALARELMEETGLKTANPQLVIVEDAGEIYGQQYIFACDYIDGEPMLGPDSIEAKISEAGQNTYKPMWLPIKDLEGANLLPIELKQAIIGFIKDGFPVEPIELTISQ